MLLSVKLLAELEGAEHSSEVSNSRLKEADSIRRVAVIEVDGRGMVKRLLEEVLSETRSAEEATSTTRPPHIETHDNLRRL